MGNLAGWLPLVATVIWVVAVLETTKFLDGLDGLAGGVGLAASATLAILSLVLPGGNEPTAQLAAILAGALGGFLFFNLPPARAYLGEGGAAVIGFLLATLAIFTGGKVATAFLVLGLPAADAFRVVVSRLLKGRKPWQAGRDHLHHLLADAGLGAKGAALLLFLAAAALGAATFFLSIAGKIALAGILVVGIFPLAGWLERRGR